MRASPALTAFAFAVLALGVSSCGEKNQPGANGGPAASLSTTLTSADASAAAHGDSGTTVADEAMPDSSNDALALRMRHLLEAMSQNNPDLAGDILFPRDAYIASKDVADPQKAWDKRVSAPFRRNVERMFKHTKGIGHAKFVSFELGGAPMQLTPKKRDFKKPLWRVKHSKLAFSIDGKTHHVDVAEMTAWRGNWYVTRIR